MIAAVVLAADLKLGWNHVGTTNEVVGYKIYYGPSSRNYTNQTTLGYVTNATISVPNEGTIYLTATAIGIYDTETEFGNELQTNSLPYTNRLPSAVKDFVITKVTKTIY